MRHPVLLLLALGGTLLSSLPVQACCVLPGPRPFRMRDMIPWEIPLNGGILQMEDEERHYDLAVGAAGAMQALPSRGLLGQDAWWIPLEGAEVGEVGEVEDIRDSTSCGYLGPLGGDFRVVEEDLEPPEIIGLRWQSEQEGPEEVLVHFEVGLEDGSVRTSAHLLAIYQDGDDLSGPPLGYLHQEAATLRLNPGESWDLVLVPIDLALNRGAPWRVGRIVALPGCSGSLGLRRTSGWTGWGLVLVVLWWRRRRGRRPRWVAR